MNKKILIVINSLGIGGAERLVVDEIKELLRVGIDVTLVTLRPDPPKNFSTELRLGSDKFKSISFKHFLDILAWFELIRFVRRSKPDAVITQLWFANTIGRIAATVAGVRNIISFEQNVYDAIKTPKMFFADWCLQFLSKKIVAVSEAVKKSLIRHYIQETRIIVLHNSLDMSPFPAVFDRSELRKKIGVPEDVFLYIFIGRLIHQKAVDVLIESFKMIGPEAYLLIVGQGENREPLEFQAKQNGLEKRVVFLGVRNDVPQLLSASDCFILPSRYEGLPMVLIEALAAGKAIIVSDFEAAGEIITDEKNGLIVPRENVLALAEAMKRVKNDNVLRSRLEYDAKKSAERFLISNHARAILNLLKFHDL